MQRAMSLVLEDYENYLVLQREEIKLLQEECTEMKRKMEEAEKQRDKFKKMYVKTRKRTLSLRYSNAVYANIIREKENEISGLRKKYCPSDK